VTARIAAIGIGDGWQTVVVINVTGRAGRRGMRAIENETGGAVIERGICPARGGMARAAIRDREHRWRGRMRRVIGLLIIGLVTPGNAAVAVRDICQAVVVIDVARRTGRAGVKAIENETSGAVIERGGGPTRGVVASRALRHGEARSDVIRDIAAHGLRTVPILEVAGGVAAVIRLNRQRVVVIDVAGHAGSGRGRHVHASQRKTGNAVIECAQVGPRDGVMAI
jgi:hypothetical protein